MKRITHQQLEQWLKDLSASRTLVAPTEAEGVLLYRPVEDIGEITWDYIRPVQSIKQVFFPQMEPMLTIEQDGDSISLKEAVPDDPTVVFGIRSCDARGMLALDGMFLHHEPVDRYYKARRENSVLIGLSCEKMGETCFCTSMGGAPDDADGMDVMLTKVEGGYLVEVVSEAGKQVTADLALEETDLEKPIVDDVKRYRLPDPEVWRAVFDSPIWTQDGERCISCRICSYVCPTCRCFDVRDEDVPSSNGHQTSERKRFWDACSAEAYRRIAGGHNPRDVKADRLRNRMMCKLYYLSEQYGPSGCTGCGRCIESCPVGIDITEIINHVLEVQANE